MAVGLSEVAFTLSLATFLSVKINDSFALSLEGCSAGAETNKHIAQGKRSDGKLPHHYSEAFHGAGPN